MDNKLRHAFKPYSFRARMLTMLTISAIVASAISLLFSYMFSRSSVRAELQETELEVAAGLLELYQNTDLDAAGVIEMAARDNVTVVRLDDTAVLTTEQQEQLQSVPILTVPNSRTGMPGTYVRLDDVLLFIAPSKTFNVFLIAFLRISFAALSFFSVFMLMSMLASWRMSKPVSLLTRATRNVADGNFKVHLPEDRPDEIGQLMRSFNTMTNALDRTSWLQKDFIASISH